LEGYLASANTTLFLVTHDRYFLDTVCNNIMELANGNIYKYKGNYAYFLEKKAEREVSEAASVEKAKNLLRKELEWMRRQPKARTHKAQYRVDAFYETKEKASQTVVEEKLQLNMQMTRLGSKIIEINHISKSFGEKKVISEFSYTFKKGDKIGIVGKNGLGKTTLLELITQKIKPDMGSIVKGDTIEIGYYSQGGLDFRDDQRVIDVVLEIAEYIQLAKGQKLTASAFLTLFLFPPAVQYNFVSKLSGGEKRRLQLLKVLIKNPNFLILDEPTNDLDIATLNVLEDFLNSYEGCLLIVSHDRYFMDRLVEHIFGFEGEGKIKDFPGNYTDYREWKEDQTAPQPPMEEFKETTPSSKAPPSGAGAAGRKLSFKEQKEYENLEKEIANLEQRKEETIQKMNNGGNHAELNSWAKEIEKITNLVDEKSLRWLELAEFI
jgi:ABC transport system ATP-binding/permease protein